MKKKVFTLIEILVVSVIISFVFVIIISFYFKALKIKTQVLARQDLMKSSYFILEKLNILMKDYKIDYEEYFNRRIVWCDGAGWDSFKWDVGDNGYCDRFTHYGSDRLKDFNTNIWEWNLYYCSSQSSENSPHLVFKNNSVSDWSGCWNTTPDGWPNKTQSFWEYSKQFWDVKDDADGTWWIVWDDDDVDLGKGPIAIWNNTWVQELYLISKDWKKRLFIRRALIDSGDFNDDGQKSDWEKLYTLQMLRLKWFDAWKDHSFSTINDGAYDWVIDTWACDWSEGFKCNGDLVWGVYSNYKLPKDIKDWWINIFPSNITITNWNLIVYPNKDPKLAWAEDYEQINPYVRIKINTKLYWKNRRLKISPATLSGYEMTLETTFNIKTYY